MSPNSRLLDNSAAVRSIGLVVVAKLGRMPLSFLSVSGASLAIGMPTAVAASAVRPGIADGHQPLAIRLPSLQVKLGGFHQPAHVGRAPDAMMLEERVDH